MMYRVFVLFIILYIYLCVYYSHRNVFYKRQRLKRLSDADTKCRGPAEETRYHVCNKQVSRFRSIIKHNIIFYIRVLIYLIKLITGCFVEVIRLLCTVDCNYWRGEKKKKCEYNIFTNNYTVTIQCGNVDFQ